MAPAFRLLAVLVWVPCIALGAPSGDPGHWEIQASLFTSTSRDTQNYVGVDADALQNLDPQDILAPPDLFGRLSLSIEEEDTPTRARDMQPPLVRSHTWHLRTSNLSAGRFHFILFDGLETVPAEYSILVIDATAGVRHDLRTAPQYLFVPLAGEAERMLQLEVSNPVPKAPKQVAAVAESDCATVTWDARSEADVVGYRVYAGTAPRVYDRSWDIGLQSEFQVDGLECNNSYYFAVSAVDRSSLEGPLSAEASVSVGPEPTPTPTAVPMMTFDVVADGNLDYRDLFVLAGSWMAPVRLTPPGKRPIFRNVTPVLLDEFMVEWRMFHPPGVSRAPLPDPTPAPAPPMEAATDAD